MKHLLDSLPAKPPKFDTLVHLGAGPFFDADLYAALPARRYILVEADPDSAADLQLAASAPFEVLEKLVAPAPGSQQFRRFSLPALNGLLGLGAWQAIYPRTKEVMKIRLPATTPAQLLADLALSADGQHALVLGLPGLETDLLAAFLAEAQLRFDWIFLSGGGTPLRDQAKPLAEALKVAGKHHFQVQAQDKLRDPLQPVVLLQRDRRALELQALRRERDEARQERDALKKTATERAMRIAELEAQVADQAERQKQIDEEMAKAEGQLEMLKDLLRPSLT